MTENTAHQETLTIAYLTGQASKKEVAEYQALFDTDAGFRELVSEIGLWLAPLNETVEDRPVPVALLENILSEINASEGAPPKSTAMTALPVPANDRSVKRWKLTSFAASIAAVLAIGSHFITAPDAPMPNGNQQLMALLSDNTQPQLMAIVYDPATGGVVARLSNITIPDDGDLQLWLIREGGEGPVSLGVLDRAKANDQIEFNIPRSLQGGTDTLAVSLEGLGGSKTAGPEGPVLFTGSVSELRGAL